MRKLLYQANVYILTFWFLVLRRAKTADVLRVSSGESSKQDTRGIKGKRNGVIISWVCCSLYFFKSVSTINIVVTFPLVFSSVNQSVHYKHLLKPVCFIQTAFLNLLYRGIELFISDASGCMRMFVFLVLKKTVASYFSDGFSSDSGFSMRFIVTENPINKRAPFM